jgi:predicted dinucleotide-binding enzyme
LSIDGTRIGIVGAGRLGQAIARRAAASRVVAIICNSRGPESLGGFVAEVGPLVVAGTIAEAADPEIVVLAVPWSRLPEILEAVPDWEGRIIIDATNPIVTSREPVELDGRTSSEVVADGLPGAHLVKALNTLRPEHIAADPHIAGGRRVVFLAGDHERSKVAAGRLIDKLGFAPIDLGTLGSGGRLMQFPGGPLPMLNLIRLDEG